MKKVAYIDFDGVIANSKVRMAEIYNLKYRPFGYPLKNGEEVTTWDAGIPTHLVEPIFEDEHFFNHQLQVFDGLFDALTMLRKRGYEIVIYTKAHLLNASHKAKWINDNLKEHIDGWIFTGSANLTTGKHQYDMSVDRKDGFSILIDDSYFNLVCDKEDRCHHHLPTYSICAKLAKRKDESWNSKWTNEKFTIYNWSELENIINRLEHYENNVIR